MSRWGGYFDWDEGNENHATRHGVELHEVEEALLDPDQVTGDAYGVGLERREAIIGETEDGKSSSSSTPCGRKGSARSPLARLPTRRRGDTGDEHKRYGYGRDTQLR